MNPPARGLVKGERLALDATLIKAWSRRDPANDSHGLSDPDARVGRDGKTYDLGYKSHVAVDADSDIPIAVIEASANENEKRHAEGLLNKASPVVDGFKSVVADSQYSSKCVRDCILGHGALTVVPYMSNQRCGGEVLRVDRFFRISGPVEERRVYGRGRASVERVNSRLDLVGLGNLKLRRLRNVMVHVVLYMIALSLVALAALSLNRPWKARLVASFWW